MVKMYDFKKQYGQIKNKIDESIQSVLNDSAFSNGKYVQSFELKFSNYLNSKYCVAVNNGTSALHISLLALGIKPDDEVLIPSFSFFATCESVSLTGAVPVFVDSKYDNFNIDLHDLESKITNKTKAIICVHLYGNPCDMDSLNKIAKKYNLYLIEDAAQAHGAIYNDIKIGNFSDFACFSFYPTKNLGAYGEGGAVITNSKKYYNKLLALRNHGSVEQYKHDMIGHNYRMSGFQGAILSVKLNYLDIWNEIRIKNAEYYSSLLMDIKEIKTPVFSDNSKHVFHQYTIKVENRDKLKTHLYNNKIESAIYYPKPCHLQKPYENILSTAPISEKLSKEVISLPIAEHISNLDIKLICESISKFYN